jgi:hypothetical protein
VGGFYDGEERNKKRNFAKVEKTRYNVHTHLVVGHELLPTQHAVYGMGSVNRPRKIIKGVLFEIVFDGW